MNAVTRPTKTSLKRKADRLFGIQVRARGHCEAAGFDDIDCNGGLQTAHIVRRRYLSVRWDLDNAACLCQAHHVYFTWHPLAEERFHTGYLGAEHFEALKKRAETARGAPDYEAILERLKEEG